MSVFEKAEKVWEAKRKDLANRPWSRLLREGQLGLPHYKGFLLETYHNAGLNPQLQGYASMFIQGRPRDIVKKFLQHAISEIGHDLLALSDLEHLGVEKEFVLSTRPLPETRAFYANTVFDTQTKGTPAYLAYLFHLEYTPITEGAAIMQMLQSKGVPKHALSFLEEHSTIDVMHLKLMRSYLDQIVTTKYHEDEFLTSLSDCMVLHNHVLEAAYENGERLFA